MMMKDVSNPSRPIMRAVLGLLLAGVVGFFLLVGAWIMAARTAVAQAEAAQAQKVEAAAALAAAAQEQRKVALEPLTGETPSVPPRQSKREITMMRQLPEETRRVWMKDPETGKMHYRDESYSRLVPEKVFVDPPAADDATVLERRAAQLAARIRQTRNEAEKETLRQELLQNLATEFEERRKRQSEAIENLEKQLQELRTLYAQRGERKDAIIQRRLGELLAERDVLAWDSPLDAATAPLPALIPSLPAPSRPPSQGGFERGPITMRQPATIPRANADPFAVDPAKVDPFTRKGPIERASEGAPFDPSTADPFGSFHTPKPEAREEKTAPSDTRGNDAELELRLAVPAEAPLKGSFTEAERVLDLLLENSELLRSSSPGHPVVAPRLQQARARLELAEIRWAQTGRLLEEHVTEAMAQVQLAQERRKQDEAAYKLADVPYSKVLDAEADLNKAAAEVRNAENLLRTWKQAEAVLQKHRAALESDSASAPAGDSDQPSEDAGTDDPAEKDPSATENLETLPPSDSESP